MAAIGHLLSLCSFMPISPPPYERRGEDLSLSHYFLAADDVDAVGQRVEVATHALSGQVIDGGVGSVVGLDLGDGTLDQGINAEGGAQCLLLPVARFVH